MYKILVIITNPMDQNGNHSPNSQVIEFDTMEKADNAVESIYRLNNGIRTYVQVIRLY